MAGVEVKGAAQLFSSAKTGGTDSWGTPQAFYDLLHGEFSFTLDPCASADNAKAPYFSIDEGVDGLAQDWGKNICFVNFPYSDAKRWAVKCLDAARKGATVVVLCPSRTDAAWWQLLVNSADEVRFVRGRLAFVGPTGTGQSATFPSSVIVLRPSLYQSLCVNFEDTADAWGPRMTLWELPSGTRRGVAA